MENYPENYPEFERELTSALGLTRKPIAVSFHDHAPAGIARFEGTVPSGCSFWRLAAERPLLRVVADQRGCPTAAADIAAALIVIAEHIERGEAKWGTYHFVGADAVSWHSFAEAIFDLAAPQLAARPQVEPITTDQYPTPARRPMNSVLDCRKIEEAFGIRPPPWRVGLASMIREVLNPTPQR